MNAIAQTRDGTLWFASGEGLTSLRDNRFTPFTIADGLPHADLRNLHEARDGTLWIASIGGLGSFKDGKFTKYAEIPPIQIRSIYEDADGGLWFGTYDEGIFRYKNGESKLSQLKTVFSIRARFRFWKTISIGFGFLQTAGFTGSAAVN